MKKLFIALSIVFLVLAIASGAFFYLKWDSVKNETVEQEFVDAGKEPGAPVYPYWRGLPYQEYINPALEEEYQASLDEYNKELETYNQGKAQLFQQAEVDYQNALKQRDDRATTKLMLMIISLVAFILLAITSLLIAVIAGKKNPATVSQEKEMSARQTIREL